VLDADERVSSELRNAIDRALANVGAEVAGFAMPRLVHYFGNFGGGEDGIRITRPGCFAAEGRVVSV
jgi:hypothetical protein